MVDKALMPENPGQHQELFLLLTWQSGKCASEKSQSQSMFTAFRPLAQVLAEFCENLIKARPACSGLHVLSTVNAAS